MSKNPCKGDERGGRWHAHMHAPARTHTQQNQQKCSCRTMSKMIKESCNNIKGHCCKISGKNLLMIKIFIQNDVL